MSNPLSFPHISRLVDLPPDLAPEAFDITATTHAGGSEGATWSLVVPSGRLDLSGSGFISRPTGASWPYRQVEGRLRPAGIWRSFAVELELLPWTDSRTELGLTLPNGPGLLATRHSPASARAGGDVLEALRSAMDDQLATVLEGLARSTEERFPAPSP